MLSSLTLLFGALAAPSLVSIASAAEAGYPSPKRVGLSPPLSSDGFLSNPVESETNSGSGFAPDAPAVARKLVDGMRGRHRPIQYMTDSEGFLQHFCQWVLDNPAIKFEHDFEGNVDHCVLAGKDAHQLLFKDAETVFVFGGDATTRGDGSKRIMRALVDFKARYPERVFLIVGNRDAMMMRLTSEWADASVHAAWVTEAAKGSDEAFVTDGLKFGPDTKQFLTYQFASNPAFAKQAPMAAPWSDEIAASEDLTKLAHLHWIQANSQGAAGSVRWGKKEQCVLHYAEERNNEPPTQHQIKEVKDNCFAQCAGEVDERTGSNAKTMGLILSLPEEEDRCGGATWGDVVNDFEELVKLPANLNALFPAELDVRAKFAFLRDNYFFLENKFGDLAWYMIFANVGLRFGPRFIVHGDITGHNAPNPEPINAGPEGAFSCIPGEANRDVVALADGTVDMVGEDDGDLYVDPTDIRQCANVVDTIDEWEAEIQVWLEKQVFAWMVFPTFVSPFPRIGVEGAVTTDARPGAKDSPKYKLMLAARQVRDRGGAALIEYGAVPSAESSAVPTVIYTNHSDPGGIKHYSAEIHAKLEKAGVTTVVRGHKPFGSEPGAWYSVFPLAEAEHHQILVIDGDTSFSNASPKTAPQAPGYLPGDQRGVAVSWIKLNPDGQVDVTSRVAMSGYAVEGLEAVDGGIVAEDAKRTLVWDTLPTAWPLDSGLPAPGSTILTEEHVSEQFRNTVGESFTTLADAGKIHWVGPHKTIMDHTGPRGVEVRVRTAQAVDGFSFYYDLHHVEL